MQPQNKNKNGPFRERRGALGNKNTMAEMNISKEGLEKVVKFPGKRQRIKRFLERKRSWGKVKMTYTERTFLERRVSSRSIQPTKCQENDHKRAGPGTHTTAGFQNAGRKEQILKPSGDNVRSQRDSKKLPNGNTGNRETRENVCKSSRGK